MKRSPVSGSSAAAELPGSALSAVAPHPVVNSAAAAITAAPNLSRLNIIVSFAKGPQAVVDGLCGLRSHRDLCAVCL
jgi:hypothetical protein